jgi:nicotinamidase-related amidase
MLTESVAYRSRNNLLNIGIGDKGPLGRLLVREEKQRGYHPGLYPLANEPVIDKATKGVFAYTEFELLLKIRWIRNSIFCGVCTDICVHTTMRKAADSGYDCLLVTNGCGATIRRLHKAGVQMVGTEGGIFGATCSTEDVLAALKAIE